MALTYKEWREEFKKEDIEVLKELWTALDIVKDNNAINKHFGWTGIFNLVYEVKGAINELEKEAIETEQSRNSI